VTEFALLDQAARGMSAQRTMLDLAARKVAAAQAAVPGRPYDRLVASLQPPSGEEAGDGDPGDGDVPLDASPAIRHEPGSGDPLIELIAVLDAQRAYEADASIFDTGKRLAERTLDIDR